MRLIAARPFDDPENAVPRRLIIKTVAGPDAIYVQIDIDGTLDDDCNQFKISVNVTNRRWGPLFGYNGSFEVEWKPVTEDETPAAVRPRREESRE